MKKTKEEEFLNDFLKPSSDIEDRCIGSILCCMIGDVLVSAVEGWSFSLIKKRYPNGIKDFIKATHMGIYHLEPRYGMYTDDTNSVLALATSLVQNQGLDPKDCAEFYFSEPLRGYPDSTQKFYMLYIMEKIIQKLELWHFQLEVIQMEE